MIQVPDKPKKMILWCVLSNGSGVYCMKISSLRHVLDAEWQQGQAGLNKQANNNKKHALEIPGAGKIQKLRKYSGEL